MSDRPALDAWGRQVTPPVATARTRRPVYGRVYELVTGDPQDGEHPYVGMTEQTIHQRVHGSSGHTSPASIAKDPWKARILPGRAGYRLLETVYDTGDAAENDRVLRAVEAFWIDRLRTTHNDVRPVRPPFGQSLPPRPKDSPGPARKAPARRKRRRVPFRVVVLLALMAGTTWLAALVVVAMALPWPAAPWIASPVLGIAGGFAAYFKIHAMGRKAKLWR